ncbi:30S ribosomal protein S14 [Acetobacteraceae bacterium EV16G]|uniref:Small ribosomal subunit protein uS14 n=2 Tax=Acetobacteraceae TaxID=433 RepID=A0ABY6GJN0_9PROT|nr:30S ribosomal protein S14 [Candidatus Kirkpatrickella diaphorinae]UYH51479.1 30S ribosomal protein S14 [Candidatus Kirkpatrickella diaphorinae]
MAKVSAVNRNAKRAQMAQRDRAKRTALKEIIKDRSLPVEERFDASLKLAEMPRNGSRTRVRLLCKVSGRPRANYRKFQLSRIALRDLASTGQIPGMVKSSW